MYIKLVEIKFKILKLHVSYHSSKCWIMNSLLQIRSHEVVDFISYVIYYPLVLAILFLNCFADGRPTIQTYPVDKVALCNRIVHRMMTLWFVLHIMYFSSVEEHVPRKSIIFSIANFLRLVRLICMEGIPETVSGWRFVEFGIRTQLRADCP